MCLSCSPLFSMSVYLYNTQDKTCFKSFRNGYCVPMRLGCDPCFTLCICTFWWKKGCASADCCISMKTDMEILYFSEDKGFQWRRTWKYCISVKTGISVKTDMEMLYFSEDRGSSEDGHIVFQWRQGFQWRIIWKCCISVKTGVLVKMDVLYFSEDRDFSEERHGNTVFQWRQGFQWR